MDSRSTRPLDGGMLPWRLGTWLRQAYGTRSRQSPGPRLVLAFVDESRLAWSVIRAVAPFAQRLVAVASGEAASPDRVSALRGAFDNVVVLPGPSGEPGHVRESFDLALAMQGAIDAVLNIRSMAFSDGVSPGLQLLPTHRHACAVISNALECLPSSDAGGLVLDVSAYDVRMSEFAQRWQRTISLELADLSRALAPRAPRVAALAAEVPPGLWLPRTRHSRHARRLIDTVTETLTDSWKLPV